MRMKVIKKTIAINKNSHAIGRECYSLAGQMPGGRVQKGLDFTSPFNYFGLGLLFLHLRAKLRTVQPEKP